MEQTPATLPSPPTDDATVPTPHDDTQAVTRHPRRRVYPRQRARSKP